MLQIGRFITADRASYRAINLVCKKTLFCVPYSCIMFQRETETPVFTLHFNEKSRVPEFVKPFPEKFHGSPDFFINFCVMVDKEAP